MYYKTFSIENFKGINKVKLDLSNNRILTLVGLNESGKTTILEALELFYEMIKGKTPNEQDLNFFRPKGIAFTGTIKISGTAILEDEDKEKLLEYWKSLGKKKKLEFPNEFSYHIELAYKVHKYESTNRKVTFAPKVQNAINYLNNTDNSGWQLLVQYVKDNLIPEILYYEDFTFQIPDRITWTKNPPEVQKKTEWQLVLDDVLKTVNSEFNSFQEEIVNIWDTDNDNASNRISRMEGLLNKKITASWKELFKESEDGKKSAQKLNFKEIKLLCTPEGDSLHVAFKVKTDSDKEFSINERSKGCKWFFSFLIFTEFRKNRTKNILFLLDEPASNLHSSAQTKILEAIEQLSNGSMVIYSTHSHHLINPLWLSGAYVIINEAISDEVLEGNITDDDTAKITAQKYYNYVGKGKGTVKNLYYQPILDCLDYAPSAVEPIPNITITEGKNDWYTFKYFAEIILGDEFAYNFYPGSGRDNHWDVIRLYLSWGKEFLLILDGDKPGEDSKANYIKEFNGYVENKIFTLKDIFESAFKTEDLINEGDRKIICDIAFGEGSYEIVKNNPAHLKSKLNFAFNQLLVKKQTVKLSKETKDNFRKLLKFIKSKYPAGN